MARIRSIKPEFFSSEQVAECSPIARLLFVGMWCFCDDGGVHPASAKALKMRVFPGDDLTAADVSGFIDELIRNGLLEAFEAENSVYWRITGWSKHQKIDRPTFKYPQNSTPARKPIDDDSASDRRELVERLPPEGRGGEGNGEERKGVNPLSVASASAPSTRSPDEISPAARACIGLKAIGYGDTNPHDIKLKALIEAGLTADEIVAVGQEAQGKGKGFRWVLATAEGRRRDAAKVTPLPTADPKRPLSRDESRRRTGEFLTGATPPPTTQLQSEKDITGESQRVG